MAIYSGTNGADVFDGGADNDSIAGNGGNDRLSGGAGNDTIAGHAGADSISGGSGDDLLFSRNPESVSTFFATGVLSNDIYTEVDTLVGGEGDDIIAAGYGDNVDGGAQGSYGNRLMISFQGASSGVQADFRLLQTQGSITIGGGIITNIQNTISIEGSNFDDFLVSIDTYYPSGASIYGRGGNDTIIADYYAGWSGLISGGDGDDNIDATGAQYGPKVYGDAGNDIIRMRSGLGDVAYGGDGNDTISAGGAVFGGNGDDRIEMQSTYYVSQVYGEAGDDVIIGVVSGNPNGYGNDLSGGDGSDTVSGGANGDILSTGNRGDGTTIAADTRLDFDRLDGFGGDDRLYAGYGDDVDGGDGTDSLWLSLSGATGGVAINLTGVTGSQPYSLLGGTISNIERLERLIATNFGDTITVGNQSREIVIDGGGGDDVVIASGSAVEFNGGAGDDRFVSGSAADTFRGDAGFDTVDYSQLAGPIDISLATSGPGATGDLLVQVEQVIGTAGNDRIAGSGAADALIGGDGVDSLIGNGGNDTLSGGAGGDSLDGGAGADRMAGGAGDDGYLVDNAGDQVIEVTGGGIDSVIASASWAMGSGQEIETVTAAASAIVDLTGNELGNVLIGNDVANLLRGLAGADTLTGGGGGDTLDGGLGDDRMTGGLGDDSYYVDSPGDVVVENDNGGIDTILTASNHVLAQNLENLTLLEGATSGTGNALHNLLTGNSQGNSLSGGQGNDTIDGGGGIDTMIGGAGNDLFMVDNIADQVTEAAGGGDDHVITAISWTLAAGQEIERVTASGEAIIAIDLTGNEFGNTLNGNDTANNLFGLGGADMLNGGGGNDTLDGGQGNDQMAGGGGNDSYYVDSAADAIVEDAGAGFDTVLATSSFTLSANLEQLILLAGAVSGTGNNSDNLLEGNGVSNQLSGEGGDDTLSAAAGNDTLIGGSGHDILLGGEGTDSLSGGDGNDHLYGQSAAGGVDGADLLNAGAGSDYLQGNAGNDTLDGGDGSDRINGGANDDFIRGGTDNGSDTINGNLGNDSIEGGAGNDSLRGGQGNDSIAGGDGNDILFGDLGVDTLSGGTGIDHFVFGANAALFANAAPDLITDFERGTDRIAIGYAVQTVLVGAAASSFAQAATTAQQLFDEHAGGGEVAAVKVGTATYLFYASADGGAADSAIQFTGADATALTVADFV